MSHFLSRIIVLAVISLSAMASVASPAPEPKRQRQTATPTRSINSVKREQAAAKKNIKEKSRQLDVNTRKTRESEAALNNIQTELDRKSSEISVLRGDLAVIDGHIRMASDSMALLQSNLAAVKAEYIKALRKMQGTYRSSNLMSYLFSSKSFSEAMARYRYVREFGRWRERKLREIEAATAQVDSKRRELGVLQRSRTETLTSLSGAEEELKKKRDEAGRMVGELKKKGLTLQADIARQTQRLSGLDSELDRLIIAEQRRQEDARRKEAQRKEAAARQAAQKKKESERRKANSSSKSGKAAAAGSSKPQPKAAPAAEVSGLADADRALSGSFESNCGRLLFPVSGKYTIVRGFGRQAHPEMRNVVTDNSGIDIAVASGTRARSVFEGTVSGIFSADGYNKVVMIRHGKYISIYAGLSSVNVANGQKVSANTVLGTIAPDPQYDNRPVLHFELRKERTKLNPSQWVR